jgi:hypothetical protein
MQECRAEHAAGKFANTLCDPFRTQRNRPEANNQYDLPDHMTFKRQWGMIFLVNKFAIRCGDAKSLKYLSPKI